MPLSDRAIECPNCGAGYYPEQTRWLCPVCGLKDNCCEGAKLPENDTPQVHYVHDSDSVSARDREA
jgi:Zn finger protein HypA/HybF involved in hydrogenase expression